MKLKLMTLLAGLVISSSIFGQRVFNKSYKLEKESFKVSLIPILSEYDSFNDTVMSEIFINNLKNVELATPSETRKAISANQKIQDILDKIILANYKKKELKTFPNLTTLLNPSEVEYLRDQLGQPDFILIPIVFNFRSMMAHTFGYSKFRFYNLNSGEFVFEFSLNMNINVVGEGGMKDLMYVLLQETHKYYVTEFLKKYGIK